MSHLANLENLLSTTLFDIIPDVCLVFDENCCIVKMNQKAEQFFLLPKDYILSKSLWEIAPQYINTEVYNAIFKARAEKRETYVEFQALTSGRWLALIAKPIGDFVIVFIKNINAYRHTQEELLNSEKRFLVAFKKSPALMSILSIDTGQFISVNDTYTRITGHLSTSVVGKTKEKINILSTDNLKQTKELYLKNEPVKELFVTFNNITGECRNILISSESININGKPCLLEVGIDITETVKYQCEIKKFERLNLIGQMSASIAHEIRNPLQVVGGFLQLLSSKEDLYKYSNYFNLMLEELTRANQIITEFLSLSKTKSKEFKLMDINEVVKKILPLMEAQAAQESKQVDVHFNDVPKVWIDECEIKQLILNLIKNGLEAIQAHQTVKIITKCDNNSAVLSVSDQGPGIPKEVQAKIGMPFFTTKAYGTGVGLAISFNIAERHNAKLNFVTNSNGTTFSLYFPVSCPMK